MDLNWKLNRVPRPGTATVRVTDLGWQGLLNPSPLIKDDGELLVDEYLSPSKLEALTGVDDLRQVKALEMRVDTRENSLGNFGAYLPNLKHLKLNNSVLTSVRDLGTALSQLQVLWMARCGLSDLDGISSCCCLKELYIAYNNIADLSQVSLLEHLEILDLEGNNIENLSQIQYLGLCTKLLTLTLEGNPICLKPNPQSSEVFDYNYRSEVKKLISHLKCLDEIPANQTAIPLSCTTKDWLIVKKSIKEGSLADEASGIDFFSGPVTRRPCSGVRPTTPHFLSASRPQTPQRPPSAHLLSGSSTFPESTICDEILPEDDSSDLTHGVSRVICGNPIKALHARRQKLGSAVTNLFQPQCHAAEHTVDSEEPDGANGENVLAELKHWRVQHNQCLQSIQKEKYPEVLKIPHCDEKEDYSQSDSGNEEPEKHNIRNNSPDSICQSVSSSGSLHALENQLPAIMNRYLIPSPPKNPSPAFMQGVKGDPVRARCLKVPNSKKVALLKSHSYMNRDPVHHVTEKTAALNLGRKPVPSANASSLCELRHRACSSENKLTRRPISGPAAIGPTNTRVTVDRNFFKMINPHQPVVRSCTKTPERFAVLNVVRPLTAKAVLQSLPSRPTISMMAQSKTPEL